MSSSLSPLLHELVVVQRMRRLSALRLEADVRQEAASLALWVLGKAEQESINITKAAKRLALGEIFTKGGNAQNKQNANRD